MLATILVCLQKVELMEKDNNNSLNSPAASYGKKVSVRDLHYEPVDNLEETLRSQGYISLDEYINKVSKYL